MDTWSGPGRRRRRSMLVLAAAAGLSLLGGCAPAGRVGAPAATGLTFTPTGGGAVHLTDYTDNDGPTSTVILAGAVGDHGTARSVNPDGTVNPQHGSELDLVLSHGTFRLRVADLDRTFVAAVGHLATNAATCSGTTSVTGTAPIVTGSGTGSYIGIHGDFTLTVTLDEIFTPPDCTPTGAYLAQLIVMTGTGTVAFG